MSKSVTRSGRGLTRRGFLKVTGAAGALGATAVAASSASDWFKPAEAGAETEERVARTYHQSHCAGMCPLKCTVRDGRLVKIEPNTSADDRYNTVCVRGLSEIQHIYGEKRVQTPLKRVGERGTNEFVSVGWDEALDDIVDQLRSIKKESGGQSIVVMDSAESNIPFLASILGAQTGGNTGIDVGTGNGLDPATGLGYGYAMSTPDPRDWVDSKLVLTVGSNFCESTLPQVRLFFEAKEAGAHMVTVDPHFSTTASKSDEWVPIEPGTDAALFLGMASVILDEKLHDKNFMAKHTSFPFLVDKKTGTLVRDHKVKETEDGPETGAQNPFFVIDADGKAVAYDKVSKPALSGTVERDGQTLVTVFDLYKDIQKEYTAAWASEVTGISEDKIKELAREYAEGPSSLALGWGGNDKMTNADIAGHAAATLVAITGNIGKAGAGVGVYVGGTYGGYSATLGGWALPEDMVPADNDVPIYDMRKGKGAARAIICCGDTFAQKLGNMKLTEEWIKTLDLVVTCDPYFTEGAKWSDYVLPMTTRFEMDSDFGNVKSGYSQIVIQQKIIDPLFEAKTDLWLEKEIAKRWGVEDGVLPADSTEYARSILSTSEDSAVSKLTLEEIIENDAVWPVEGRDEVRRVLMDREFPTSSGRMDVYYEDMVEFGQELPVWEECSEIGASSVLREKYPLQLSNVRTRFHIHNQFNDAKWIQQYFEPTIEINPTEMEQRGLSNGDSVEVFNDRGSFKVRIAGNESVRPGSARICEGATADYMDEGNLQSVTNDSTHKRGYSLMCGPVTPFSDTLVEIKKA